MFYIYSIPLILNLIGFVSSSPQLIWRYLADLCPDGLVPLTYSENVKTCETQCPREARCVQGICCALPPNCNDLTHKFETNFVCLPKIKQNCPKNSKCVESTRDGQSICCSALPPQLSRIAGRKPLETVCPATHPVLGFERRGLQVCATCKKGLCVPFRQSHILICCHSHESLCGLESEVEIMGSLAKDCSQERCSAKYDCKFADSLAVCCSYPKCPSGEIASRICGAGCARFEKCEDLAGGRWCCPRGEQEVEMCPGEIPTSGICSLEHPDCGSGNVCVATESGLGFMCCPDPALVSLTRLLKGITPPPPPQGIIKTSSIRSPPTMPTLPTPRVTEIHNWLTIEPFTEISLTTTKRPKNTKSPRKRLTTTTMEIATLPIVCPQGGPPLGIQDAYLMCPEQGAPCPKAGFTCQETNIGDFYCCPIDEWEIEEILPTTPSAPAAPTLPAFPTMPTTPKTTTTPAPWLALLTLLPKTTTTAEMITFFPTTTPRPIPSTLYPRVPPKCPFGHHSIMSEFKGESRSCAGWLDFTCPLTYSCMASSTTLSFICCKLNHTMHDELSNF